MIGSFRYWQLGKHLFALIVKPNNENLETNQLV